MKKNNGYKQIVLSELSQTQSITIPKDWDLRKLKQIADINPEQISEDYHQKEILYVDIASIDNFLIQKYEKYKINERPSRAQRIIKKNDIIISTVRPYLKAFAKVVEDKPNMICSTGFSVLRTKNPEDLELIFNYVKGFHFETYITRLMEGMAYPAITSNVVRNSLIPYSKNNMERKNIGLILSNVDSLISSYDNFIQKTKVLKKGLIQQLLAKGIGHKKFKKVKSFFGKYVEVPENWSRKSLIEIGKLSAGGTPSTFNKNYWENGNIPWVSSGEIRNNRINHSDKKITKLGLENSAAKLFSKGTVLVAITGFGMTRGRTSILEIEASTNQSVIGIITKKEVVNDEFLWYTLQNLYWTLRNFAQGTQQPGLNLDIVEKFQIFLPDNIDEQQKIASILSEVDSRIDELEQTKSNLKSIKKGLMQKLLTGQIRVKV